MRIIAYTYEADYHCIDCTVKRFWRTKANSKHIKNDRDWVKEFDQNDIRYSQEDNEGNRVHPLFDCDEWQEFDDSFLADNPIQYLACGDCHEVLVDSTVD